MVDVSGDRRTEARRLLANLAQAMMTDAVNRCNVAGEVLDVRLSPLIALFLLDPEGEADGCVCASPPTDRISAQVLVRMLRRTADDIEGGNLQEIVQ